jgi:hypothetical protein
VGGVDRLERDRLTGDVGGDLQRLQLALGQVMRVDGDEPVDEAVGELGVGSGDGGPADVLDDRQLPG